MLKTLLLNIALISFSLSAYGQISIEIPEPKWHEKLKIRGYAQLRYNGLFETNPDLKCAQCDDAWGNGGKFSLRRVRLVFYGDVHERVFVYIQPDFAGGWNNFGQIRDAYMDIALDREKEFRFRLGQSKVPYGFENMQSSSRRLALDRNDALNSAVKNERDLGIFFYYAPKHIRERFSYLGKAGLKGSGDYGMLGIGIYNGQTANQPELNDEPHLVVRATYPFQFSSGQILEASLQAYTGEFVINTSLTENKAFQESRVAASLIYYPQPWGFQAEFNIGKGPEFDPEAMTVRNQFLHGGYAQSMYYFKTGEQLIIPFVKWQYYHGGKKHELDATRHRVNDLELGVEWQPIENFELVAIYTFSDRTFENSLNPDNHQAGSLMRFQAQVNF